MIKVIVTTWERENLYGMLVKKEVALRKRKQGTLHVASGKKANEATWKHASYPGRVRFQKCLGGVVCAVVKSRSHDSEWQLLSSFIGFLDRHFRDSVSNITISYELE